MIERCVSSSPVKTNKKQRNLTGFVTIPPYLLWLQRSVLYWANNIFYYMKHANDFSYAISTLGQKAIDTRGLLSLLFLYYQMIL